MTVLVSLILIALLSLLVSAVWVIFALLRRLDVANTALKMSADMTMAQAMKMHDQAPQQMDAILATLASLTTQTHASLEGLVKTVLTPPPVVYTTAPDALQFSMPSQDEGGMIGEWDHTDALMPKSSDWPGSVADGYAHENEPGFDPENPFGIPGMKFLVP